MSLSGAGLHNTGDAVVPVQVDGDNRVTHREPPVREGDYPHGNTHGLHGFFRPPGVHRWVAFLIVTRRWVVRCAIVSLSIPVLVFALWGGLSPTACRGGKDEPARPDPRAPERRVEELRTCPADHVIDV